MSKKTAMNLELYSIRDSLVILFFILEIHFYGKNAFRTKFGKNVFGFRLVQVFWLKPRKLKTELFLLDLKKVLI